MARPTGVSTATRPRSPLSRSKRSSMDFPTLYAEPERGQWPMPPFNWHHLRSPDGAVAEPCRIETLQESLVEGEMLRFDPVAGRIIFRPSSGKPAGSVSFHRFRQMTLTDPLVAAPRSPGAPIERVPAAAQEREYSLHFVNDGGVRRGRTAGHVETDAGLFLFTPLEDERSLERVFVPRHAYSRCEFGPSMEERAAALWIGTPEELISAIERQQSAPVRLIGEALLHLGLVTPTQLNRALSAQRGDVPLGEMLVATGVISRADLQTALAYKMGYPLVDLGRFPIDDSVAAMLPIRVAAESLSVPLMMHDRRLIVAVDRPSRTTRLNNLQACAGLKVVPVLASKGRIMATLGTMAERDVWAPNVFSRLVFAPSTV